jgi:hypothetical protein
LTLEQAQQLLQIQADSGGSYNRKSALLVLAEVHQKHGQAAVDRLIDKLHLEEIFGFESGLDLKPKKK